jgi:serine/threonine protein kinase, bacterial
LPFTVETLAAPAGPRATYAAHLPRGAGTLYLAVRDGEAIAYVCDGDRIEAWLRGTARNGALSLTSKKGGTLTGTAGDTRATGKISVRGLRVSSFTIAKVGKPSGLYKAAAKVRNADIVGGWIVLADGSQVGVVNAAGTPEPAPPLNTVTGIARITGTPVRATEIDVQTGTWFD